VKLFDVFRSRRVLVLTLLGFSSGLPLLVSGQILTAWMTEEGVNLKTIGAFSLVALPYTFKWAWAPLLDRFRLPFLGRRRGWILVLQLGLMASIAFMGSLNPKEAPAAMALAAVVVAFMSASQDVVIDAFNADTLKPVERAAGMATFVTGYRVGALVTGTLGLIMGDYLPWQTIYWALAACMTIGVIGTILAREPEEAASRPTSLFQAVWLPLKLFFSRRGIVLVVLFIGLYRLGDAFGQQMLIPFLKGGVGFSFTEIGMLNKLLGFAGAVVGGVTCGLVVARWGIKRCLYLFGALQASTNFLYVALALTGKSLVVFGCAVFVDNTANTMGTGVFVAYLMSLTDRSVSATQYALMTALSTLGARLFSYLSADVVERVGWSGFWTGTALMFVPAALLLLFLPVEEPPRKVPASSSGRS
jgi:MFS transporter, PAT family, beta-lactamase induction signal transducer AmpG